MPDMITFAPFPEVYRHPQERTPRERTPQERSRRRQAVDRLKAAIRALTCATTSKPSPPRSRGRKAVADPAKDPRPHARSYHALPLILLTTAAIAFTVHVTPWLRMWIIAFALFAGFKWWTLRRALDTSKVSHPEPPRRISSAAPEAGVRETWLGRATCCPGARSAQEAISLNSLVPKLHLGTPLDPRETPFRANFRPLTYLLLWPGTSARAFLNTTAHPPKPTARQWLWALTKTLLGATLLWGAARLFLPKSNSVHSVIPSLPSHDLAAGWIGMIGFIFLLHFGLFALLALFWQSRGIDAPPIMKCPIAAGSLHDFWGRRWNAGFRDIVFPLFFLPLARRFGASIGALLTFVLSGLIHELVITIPAGAGYGLPTLYFTLQGLGLMLERSPAFARHVAARVSAWPAATTLHRLTAAATACLQPSRLFAWAFVVLPIAALFPPVFVLRVMVPFFQLLHAL